MAKFFIDDEKNDRDLIKNYKYNKSFIKIIIIRLFYGSMKNLDSYIYNTKTEFNYVSILDIFVEKKDISNFLNK